MQCPFSRNQERQVSTKKVVVVRRKAKTSNRGEQLMYYLPLEKAICESSGINENSVVTFEFAKVGEAKAKPESPVLPPYVPPLDRFEGSILSNVPSEPSDVGFEQLVKLSGFARQTVSNKLKRLMRSGLVVQDRSTRRYKRPLKERN